MSHWTQTDIAELPSRVRANLINSIAGFKPALLVGTASASRDSNLAIFSNIFHIGATPPLIGLLVRPSPEGTARHTLDNVLATRHYTLNHITLEQAANAHLTSARYNRDESEFRACGFVEQWREDSHAPYVAGAAIQIGMQLVEHHLLSINQTHLVIGTVSAIYTQPELVREDGSVNLNGADSTVVAGLDSYHSTSDGQRFSYAKPNQAPLRQT